MSWGGGWVSGVGWWRGGGVKGEGRGGEEVWRWGVKGEKEKILGLGEGWGIGDWGWVSWVGLTRRVDAGLCIRRR